MEKIRNYINGELIAPQSGQYLDNFNPAEGKVYSLIPDSEASDVQLAVDAAAKAARSRFGPARQRPLRQHYSDDCDHHGFAASRRSTQFAGAGPSGRSTTSL